MFVLAALLVLVLAVVAAYAEWGVMSDTWVATDALGRKLPGYDECGPSRENKYVGIFYFNWLGQHGQDGPYDITKILKDNPNDPKWGPEHAFHHWGEPELGYYVSDDEWVIRRYKGVHKPPEASAPKTIKFDGRFSDWEDVCPEYRDNKFDTLHHSSKGWGSAGMYINKTGRNDIIRCKAARDSKTVYFYAETRERLTSCKDRNWMLLLIDADQDSSTGWNGYDYLINAEVIDDSTTTIKKNLGGYRSSDGEKVEYRAYANKLEIAVPRAMLGKKDTEDVSFDFHWADNIEGSGDIIDFALNGGSAPDRRANYRFR